MCAVLMLTFSLLHRHTLLYKGFEIPLVNTQEEEAFITFQQRLVHHCYLAICFSHTYTPKQYDREMKAQYDAIQKNLSQIRDLGLKEKLNWIMFQKKLLNVLQRLFIHQIKLDETSSVNMLKKLLKNNILFLLLFETLQIIDTDVLLLFIFFTFS